MKIIDLFEKENSLLYFDPDLMIDFGAEAEVFKHHNDPNKVIRISTNVDKSRYPEYIKIIKEHQTNPYFPRVFFHQEVPQNKVINLRTKEPIGKPSSMCFYTVIEKLIPIEHPTIRDTVPHLLKTVFNFKDHEVDSTIDSHGIPVDQMKKDMLVKIYDALVYHKYSGEGARENLEHLIQTTRDENLKQAVSIFINNGFDVLDLHEDNWMIRLTGHGPQIVFTDPVYVL